MPLKALDKPSSQSAVTYTPTLTLGSPRSIRIRVGTDIPMRWAHCLWDSLRRTRAKARCSPSAAKALAASGGSEVKALEDFGITYTLSDAGKQ